MLSGIFINGGDRSYVDNNNCNNNMNFGIHISGLAKSYIIERSVCNANGGTLTNSYYGRGIELSSKVGQDAVSGHTIRYNTCRFNYNYGGPLDNGSEGVGIGVDDGTSKCLVYGKLVSTMKATESRFTAAATGHDGPTRAVTRSLRTNWIQTAAFP